MEQTFDISSDPNQDFISSDMADIDVVFLPVYDLTRHVNGLSRRTPFQTMPDNYGVSLNDEVEKVSKKIQSEIECDFELYGYPIEMVANREKFGTMLNCLSCFFCKEIVRNPMSCGFCRQLYCKQCIEAAINRHCGKPCTAQSKPGALCDVEDVCVPIIHMLDCLLINCGICSKEIKYENYEEHRINCKKLCEECGFINNGLGHVCVNITVTSLNKWKEEFKNSRREFYKQNRKMKALENFNNRLIGELVFTKSKLDENTIKRGNGGFSK